jgi:hypothetical protein
LIKIASGLAVVDHDPTCTLDDLPVEQHQWRRDAPTSLWSLLLEPWKCRQISTNVHKVVPASSAKWWILMGDIAQWINMMCVANRLRAYKVGLTKEKTSLQLTAINPMFPSRYSVYYLNFDQANGVKMILVTIQVTLDTWCLTSNQTRTTTIIQRSVNVRPEGLGGQKHPRSNVEPIQRVQCKKLCVRDDASGCTEPVYPVQEALYQRKCGRGSRW